MDVHGLCSVCVGTDFRCIGMLSQFKVERHLEACLRHTQVHTHRTNDWGGPRGGACDHVC